MTAAQFSTIAKANMTSYSTTELVEVAKKLFFDMSNTKDIIFDAVIDILQSRMTEAEFSNLVNSL